MGLLFMPIFGLLLKSKWWEKETDKQLVGCSSLEIQSFITCLHVRKSIVIKLSSQLAILLYRLHEIKSILRVYTCLST